jgi:mRNA interferase MazF
MEYRLAGRERSLVTVYNANQGDIVWIDLDPQAGHEQKGRRPALIVSNNAFNRFEQVTAMVCPITNTDRSIPIQIKLDGRTKTSGVIMCDQAKILDLKKRNAEFIESVPDDIICEAVDIISGFLEII